MKPNILKTLVLLLFVYLIFVLSSNLLGIYKAGGRVEEAREKLEAERIRNEELRKKVAEVQSEEFVEREAREKLNLQKEGELVVILPESEVRMGVETEKIAEKANWEKWWELFR